uniref:NADH-ubiquinone oxidoreductase chain 2 n=1 Tax=Folsomotoma octooculata TaxID=1334185 RepID=A0A059PIK2_9HEXA|nr:NADH dehydrogenase subunit 2 [Folsomotoma octooculata]AGL95071.1 NADH dehydrogenase subunit 2 [Folsomotoma octooculata]
MLMKNYQMMFLLFLTMGILIAVSSNSWFLCWLGLEINLMSMIPLIIIKLNSTFTEAAIKYFLTQAMASLIMIISSMLENSLFNMFLMQESSLMILLALSIKSGLAPFHYWFPQVMLLMKWFQCSIILTIQKIAPFMLMSFLPCNKMIFFIVMMSAMVGSLGGLNQLIMKTILTFSSIAHSSWMLLLIFYSMNSWMFYFIIYSMIILTMIFLINFINLSTLSEMNNSKMSNINKLIFIVNILSLGGLPPFMGFLAKLNAIFVFMFKISTFVMLILITASLVSLFYYLKISYFIIMSNNQETNISMKYNSLIMKILFTMTMTGNIFTPIMVSLT